jgi:tRNA-2-methylthio-N6-dimethylallyladenosine synthase
LSQVDAARQAHLKTLPGSVQRVLFEGQDKQGKLSGRTDRNEIVHVPGPSQLLGEIAEVRITEAYKNSLAAELLNPPGRDPHKGKATARHLPIVI